MNLDKIINDLLENLDAEEEMCIYCKIDILKSFADFHYEIAERLLEIADDIETVLEDEELEIDYIVHLCQTGK